MPTLKGWMSTPRGSLAFLSSASVSGILVRVDRNMSLLGEEGDKK